ncbi:MAG TPA: RAMP superfamily CRISPR-associated protein [Kofleriaceae bacterium]|nr:RAMP superfamily CRISPR-associated protein [Kofleriaceae bacterium]
MGSGSKQFRAPHVVLLGARIQGRPGIPGSSVKGVLRARYEAITRSCTSLVPDRKASINSRTGIKKAYLTATALRAPVLSDGCTEKSSCSACALFGRMSLRSRITVTDLVSDQDTRFVPEVLPERFSPNLHHVGPAMRDASGTAFEVHGLHGRKFHLGKGPAADTRQHVEAIPAGARLTGQIRCFNVTPAELGGLLTALGCEPASALKLGGGKAHELGRARARCAFPPDGPPIDLAQCRRAFLESPDRWADGETRLVELHRGAC